MAHFYEIDVEGNDGVGNKSITKDVLYFSHESGFEGKATDEHKEKFAAEYKEFLDSKDPKKIAEKKAAKVAALRAELEALEGGK